MDLNIASAISVSFGPFRLFPSRRLALESEPRDRMARDEHETWVEERTPELRCGEACLAQAR
jgi:hypothetical protein